MIDFIFLINSYLLDSPTYQVKITEWGTYSSTHDSKHKAYVNRIKQYQKSDYHLETITIGSQNG